MTRKFGILFRLMHSDLMSTGMTREQAVLAICNRGNGAITVRDVQDTAQFAPAQRSLESAFGIEASSLSGAATVVGSILGLPGDDL